MNPTTPPTPQCASVQFEPTSAEGLKRKHGIPAMAFVHIPNGWNQVGYVARLDNRFEVEPIYRAGGKAYRESELLQVGWATFRVQIDRHTVRDWQL